MSTHRWPAHPRPHLGESLSSWLTRVARANASTLSTWLAAEAGRFSPRSNFDTQHDPKFWALLADRTGLPGGPAAVRDLTHVNVVTRLGPHVAGRWLLTVESRVARPKHRWCPRCLAEDRDPYFRRAWRLEWVRWCPEHRLPLLDGCLACGAILDFRRVSWNAPLTRCWRCESDLTGMSGPESRATEFVQRAVKDALATLQAEGDERTETWGAVWCLQKWVEFLGYQRWPDLAAALGAETEPPIELAGDRAGTAAYTFALGWHFATGAGDALPALVRRFQSAFNRATNHRCPSVLLPLRRLLASHRPVTASDVEMAVRKLLDADQPVHCVAVARLLGVNPHRVTDCPELRAIVDGADAQVRERWVASIQARLTASRDRLAAQGSRLSRAALAADAGVSLETIAKFEKETGETLAVSPCETYEAMVCAAIEALRQRKERITTTAVCRELGRDRSLIEKRPELKAVVRTARGTAV